MSLLFAGGMASGNRVSITTPQGTEGNVFVNGMINHFKNSKFPNQNINLFRAGSGAKLDCYPSPAATYPAVKFQAGASSGATYQNCYFMLLERFIADAKQSVNSKGKIIVGARVERTAPLSTGPLISFGVGLTYYGIPATNELETYCEAVIDFTNNVLQGYINGVLVYSSPFDSALPTSCFIGSYYITPSGASSPAASIAPNGAIMIRDCYVALDSDDEESPFGVQGGIRIAYTQDVTENGGDWSSVPLLEVKTKIMRNGGTGGSLAVSNTESGTLTMNKPLIEAAGTWTPVGATVESWSSRTDPSNVTALDITVSTVEGREAIRGKSTTGAALSVGHGVTKQLPAKDYSFETGVKLSIIATKP